MGIAAPEEWRCDSLKKDTNGNTTAMHFAYNGYKIPAIYLHGD